MAETTTAALAASAHATAESVDTTLLTAPTTLGINLYPLSYLPAQTDWLICGVAQLVVRRLAVFFLSGRTEFNSWLGTSGIISTELTYCR
jgi:hypothetical protein